MTALAMGFNTCCVDRRVDAVVAIAGQLATFPGGAWGTGLVPVLLVHGRLDETVPYTGSGEALQGVGTSAYLLTVEQGDHGGYLGGDDADLSRRAATRSWPSCSPRSAASPKPASPTCPRPAVQPASG